MNTTPTPEQLSAEMNRKMALSHLRSVEAALLAKDPESALTIVRDLSHKCFDYYHYAVGGWSNRSTQDA